MKSFALILSSIMLLGATAFEFSAQKQLNPPPAKTEKAGKSNTVKKSAQSGGTHSYDRNKTRKTYEAHSDDQKTKIQRLAQKLNITGLSLKTLNHKDKPENKVSKVGLFRVTFYIMANRAATPGLKKIYVRILTPDGQLIGAGDSFIYDGSRLNSSATKSIDYANEEMNVSIDVPVNTTLFTGDYKVEVYCEDYLLGSRKFPLEDYTPQEVKEPPTPEKIVLFSDVDKKAEFPGGQKALIKYLSENIHYPEQSRHNNVQGVVLVKFIVDSSGSISHVEIIRGVNDELDAEAKRVVEGMPRWVPGKNKGEAVSSWYTLPITFKPQKGK